MSFWQEFINALKLKYKTFPELLDKGVSEEDIDAFSEEMNLVLPESFKEIYRVSNGQKDKSTAFFFGMAFLSLEEIKFAMKQEYPLIEELSGEGDMCSSFPQEHIHCAYANKNWIPIFHGGGGAYLGIDLDPAPKGTKGQVINFGINDEDKFVYANELPKFIQDCTNKVTDGNKMTYDGDVNMYFYTDLYFPSAIAKELMEKNS